MSSIAPPAPAAPAWQAWLPSRQTVPILGTLLVLILMYVAAGVRYEHFFNPQIIFNILGDNAALGVAAIGMTFVILAGGIDLSIGSAVGFTTIFLATRMGVDHHWHPVTAIAAALLIGTVFGLVQGLLISIYDLPPFLVTLGGLFLYRGLALKISHEQPAIKNDLYNWMSRKSFILGDVGRLKLTAVIFLVLLVITIFIAARRAVGRNVYAVGGNEQSALLMGLPVNRIKVGVYAVSGLFAALGGVVMTINTPSGAALNGGGMELDAIAAVVIGGTLLTGGVGGPIGTLLGVMIFGIIRQMIFFEGSSKAALARIFLGLLLLVFIVLQTLIQPKENHA